MFYQAALPYSWCFGSFFRIRTVQRCCCLIEKFTRVKREPYFFQRIELYLSRKLQIGQQRHPDAQSRSVKLQTSHLVNHFYDFCYNMTTISTTVLPLTNYWKNLMSVQNRYRIGLVLIAHDTEGRFNEILRRKMIKYHLKTILKSITRQHWCDMSRTSFDTTDDLFTENCSANRLKEI